MGTLGSHDITSILTISSPTSKKVTNILENPNVEWMFTDKIKHTVICLRGVASVVHEPDDLKSA